MMRYKESFVMSKYVNMESLLRAKVNYLEEQYDHVLQRLHDCKRDNREDKVKLRNVIATSESYIGELEEINDCLEHTCDDLWTMIQGED